MVSFDKTVLLWVMRIADLEFDAQTSTEAMQGRWKITALRAPHPARIAIDGDAGWAAILLQALHHTAQSGFSGQVGTHLSIQQDGGSHIHGIVGLDLMLLFGERIAQISSGTGDILKIELPALQSWRAFHRLMVTNWPLLDAAMLFEIAVNGTALSWNGIGKQT